MPLKNRFSLTEPSRPPSALEPLSPPRGWEVVEVFRPAEFVDCIEIADAATQENCNVARLRVDTRKWAAARLAPKKYGDHMSHDVKGGTNVNFQPQILIQCSSEEEEGFIDVRAAPEAVGGAPQQGNGNPVRGR